MRRRYLLSLSAIGLGLPRVLRAQQPRAVRRVGYLGTGSAVNSVLDAFQQALRGLGWAEGQNLMLDYRFADGRDELLPILATELVRLGVDVIVASPTPATLAAKNATNEIPIVGVGFDNPVERGLVASLAHPGGLVTGVSYSTGPEIFGKDLELLRELTPEIKRVAVLSNSNNPNHGSMIDAIKTAAQSIGIELLVVDARSPDDFESAFASLADTRVGALFVFGDPMFGVYRTQLTGLAATNRLPSMYTNKLHVEAGGLMCYGPSFVDLWRRAAVYVDKILKGAKPADLPVEQPTNFELVINLNTARSLGLTIPATLLARADEVIE